RRLADGGIEGVIIAVDRFGNAITNLVASGATGAPGGVVHVGGRVVPIRRVYADVGVGEVVALAGSNGLLEVAVREGRAEEVGGVGRGGRVVLYRGA
ncbi:MAG TPA: SAM hydroxide adenosyltransferase, partial [Gemmatirosa sp.]